MATKGQLDLTVVGIGSSAGGLEAIRQLVHTLPANLPVAYVVVQHMSPHHKSLMTELVARDSSLEVKEICDQTVPEKNVVYITPPKADVIFQGGELRLVEPSQQIAIPKPSVDRFLISLAQEIGDKAMAIILSGTGSDGSYGVQAVREAGGITMAQDNESAKYDGMPQSAVQTGCIDLVLTPSEIAEHLPKILTSPRDFSGIKSESASEGPNAGLLQILLAKTQVDFRDYKATTIGRRIERRMLALGIESKEEYTKYCRSNPEAVEALFKDLLISVTRFFRDQEAFDQLAKLLPELIDKSQGSQLRIWIAGCATGEEAYTVAMLLCEEIGGSVAEFSTKVQIFATDIDRAALAVARKGIYGLSALNSIPPELAKKYLIRQKNDVRVIESLRAAILFSDHNLCLAPPFQKVDLICCRNLLIYFNVSLQKRVMARFHYAMSPHSLMFLGSSESISGSDDLFVRDSEASLVFRKRSLNGRAVGTYNMPNISPRTTSKVVEVKPPDPSTDKLLLRALAQSLGPNSILVTDEYYIAEVFGDVSPYIALDKSTSLRMHIDLLKRPLRDEARSLMTIALKTGKVKSGVRHLLSGPESDQIRLDVYPIISKSISERAALVVFSSVVPAEPIVANDASPSAADGPAATRIRALEKELAAARDALQQTIEELETSNEELQSLNEELQSTNEEMQATNEELETSNEELQSTNEELITVNEELQITASELTGRTGELASVLESSPLAIIVTDNALQISQATSAAASIFGLKLPILNPHISQCVLPDGYPPLAPVCNEALRLGETIQDEFNVDGARVSLTCSPYFDGQGQISGATIVVTQFPGLAQEMEMVLGSNKIFVMHRTLGGEILRVSNASAGLLGVSHDAAVGRNIGDFFDAKTTSEIRSQDLKLHESGSHDSIQVIKLMKSKDETPTWLNTTSFPYVNQSTGEHTIYSVGISVTDMIMRQNEEQEVAATRQLVQDMANIGNWSIDLATNAVFWSREVHRIHGTNPKEFKPTLESGLNFYHPDDRAAVADLVEQAIANGKEFRFVKRIVSKNGKIAKVQANCMPISDEQGIVVKIIGVFREVF